MYAIMVFMEPQIQYDCFSTKTQLVGNALSFQLIVMLIPYEGLNVDLSKDMCYLLSATTATINVIYSNTIQFTGSFVYIYNAKINVTINLDKATFDPLMELEQAMYVVSFKSQNQITGSFNSVQYLLKDTSSCFKSKPVLQFYLRDRFQINVEPNECQIDMSQVTVYMPFSVNGVNYKQPIYPCQTASCQDEYTVSSQFKDIKRYTMRVVQCNDKPNSAACLTICMWLRIYILNDPHAVYSLVIEANNNGVISTIDSPIGHVEFPDVQHCMGSVFPRFFMQDSYIYTQWQQSPTFNFDCYGSGSYITNTRFIQLNATITSSKDQKSYSTLMPVEEFKKRQNGMYLNKSSVFDVDLTGYTTEHDVGITIDYVFQFLYNETAAYANGIPSANYILYQFSIRSFVEFPCISYAYVKQHQDKICVRASSSNFSMCKNRTTSSLQVQLFSQNDYNQSTRVDIGSFMIQPQLLNYSVSEADVCFSCSELAEGQDCQSVSQQLQDAIRKRNAKFEMITDYEHILFDYSVSYLYTIAFWPVYIIVSLIAVIVGVTIAVVSRRQ